MDEDVTPLVLSSFIYEGQDSLAQRLTEGTQRAVLIFEEAEAGENPTVLGRMKKS